MIYYFPRINFILSKMKAISKVNNNFNLFRFTAFCNWLCLCWIASFSTTRNNLNVLRSNCKPTETFFLAFCVDKWILRIGCDQKYKASSIASTWIVHPRISQLCGNKTKEHSLPRSKTKLLAWIKQLTFHPQLSTSLQLALSFPQFVWLFVR